MTNYKKIIFATTLLLLLFAGSFALAANPPSFEIKNYPPIPGYVTPDPKCQGNDCLGIFISYWFGVGIYIAGTIALISLAIGGVRYMTSAGNPEAVGDAKDRIKGALLGMALVMASFILIRTINPQLITPTLTPLPGVQGIFYSNDSNGTQRRPVGISEPNTSARPEGFNYLYYDCKPSDSGPNLFVWRFPKPGLESGNEDLSGVNVNIVHCNTAVPVSDNASFRMAFETPGVYYYLTKNCSGYMSGPNFTSQEEIDALFSGKVKGVRFINDGPKHIYYGVIFHQDKNRESVCQAPIWSDTGGMSKCFPVKLSANSADIFLWNRDDILSSGSGVTFYSKSFGENTGTNSGYVTATNDDLSQSFVFNASEQMLFNYAYVDVIPEERLACLNFSQVGSGACSGSIELHGNYLVAVYSSPIDQYTGYCFTTTKNVPDILATPIKKQQDIDYVYIIPTR